jgi:hypothetical protein
LISWLGEALLQADVFPDTSNTLTLEPGVALPKKISMMSLPSVIDALIAGGAVGGGGPIVIALVVTDWPDAESDRTAQRIIPVGSGAVNSNVAWVPGFMLLLTSSVNCAPPGPQLDVSGEEKNATCPVKFGLSICIWFGFPGIGASVGTGPGSAVALIGAVGVAELMLLELPVAFAPTIFPLSAILVPLALWATISKSFS